jgi:hypothetical protein
MINMQRIPYFFEASLRSDRTSSFISFNEKVMALPMQRHSIFQVELSQSLAFDVRLIIKQVCKIKSPALALFEVSGADPDLSLPNR